MDKYIAAGVGMIFFIYGVQGTSHSLVIFRQRPEGQEQGVSWIQEKSGLGKDKNKSKGVYGGKCGHILRNCKEARAIERSKQGTKWRKIEEYG